MRGPFGHQMWRVPKLPHAEVLHSAPSRLGLGKLSLAPQDEGGMEPRSTHDSAPDIIRVG